jgi:hypothetical protein
MTYRIDKRLAALIEELHTVRAYVETLLDVASTDARLEWGKLVQRLPAMADIKSGRMNMTPAVLEEMLSKSNRFAAILQARRSEKSERTRAGAPPARRPS